MADGVTVPEYPAIALPFVGSDLIEITRVVGDVLTTKCTFDELKAAILAGIDAPSQFSYAPNNVYFTTFRQINGAPATSSYTANTQRALRIRVSAKVKVTPQVNVTVAVAASNMCVGLYSPHPTTGLPDVLKYDLGQVSCATTGVKSLTQTTVEPGDYYLVTSNSAAFSLTATPLNLNAEDANFTAIVGRLEATHAYVFPIGAMSGYTWTQTVTAPTTPVLFRVDAP